MSPGSTVTRSGASLSTWWRQTDDNPIATDDDRRLAGLVDEHPQGRVGVADEPLAADVRAGPDVQLRAHPELAAVAIDEPEVAQRPQVAIDGRERHVEGRAELVGADLAPIGDGQQEAQTAGERGVVGGFLGWPVARGGHAWSSDILSRRESVPGRDGSTAPDAQPSQPSPAADGARWATVVSMKGPPPEGTEWRLSS